MDTLTIRKDGNAPFVHLIEEAREELCMIYGGSIPYEIYQVLAAMYPGQCKEVPVGIKEIGELKTVWKFRQLVPPSKKEVLARMIMYYQRLKDSL